MFRHQHLARIRDAEKELLLAEMLLLEEFPLHPYCRDHDKILFEFQFSNIKVLQPMDVTKVIGAFSGALVLKDAEGDALAISDVKNLTLVADNAAIGEVALTPDAGGNPTLNFAGKGLAAGKLTLTASCVNDAGATITGVSTITFHADTTVTELDVNVL